MATEFLTASRLSTFRECARKHDLRYRQGFRPVVDAEPLRFGSLVHAGLEAWWKAEYPERRLFDALGAVEHYEGRTHLDEIKAAELLRGYDARWGAEEFDAVIGAELQFDAPLLNPETWQPSRTYRLAGKVDVLVRKNARTIVLEHKTTAESIDDDADHYWQKLSMDHQLSLYVLGAESLGAAVDECLYDVIHKPALRQKLATPVDERKYKKDGSIYANQREHDETPDEFRMRLREEIAANPEKYFQRRQVPRMNSQLEDFMHDAWQTAKNIREQEIAGRAPRNPEACWRFGKCPYWEVCANGLDLATSPDFVLLSWKHPELEQPKEENNGTQTEHASA